MLKEAFRVSHSIRRRLANRKRRIARRLGARAWDDQAAPMFTASNIHYDVAERTRGLAAGGIGAMHLLARRVGLVPAIDESLELLKVHLPYHESDHVLNIAYNILSGGTALEDLESRRNDEVYLDALGAQRIPDPTTAGDFCRRFSAADVEILMDAINRVRVGVWRRQPASFFEQATIDADGTLAPTTGECKEGMDVAYNGTWGYHPLLVSLANTQEPLYLVNRSGNRPSHEGAAAWLDQAIGLCRQAGFRSVLLRGDTDFSQTAQLDRWDGDGVQFLFGIDARANLVERAEELPKGRWKRLRRPQRRAIKTAPRRRPANVKEQIVVEREFQNIRLQSEDVAEFSYRPVACRRDYRVVVVRKNLAVSKGEQMLLDDVRYFFYITNAQTMGADELVLLANGRANQENLIEQLKNGVKALRMPVDDLTSNWAYMVMASLAWTLKAWFALVLPEGGRWGGRYREQKRELLMMEFRKFLNYLMRVPCQVVRSGGRIMFRLLSWNPWQEVLLRGMEALRYPLRT
ncbi:MAG: IS1380 family transposase [bacterium]